MSVFLIYGMKVNNRIKTNKNKQEETCIVAPSWQNQPSLHIGWVCGKIFKFEFPGKFEVILKTTLQ